MTSEQLRPETINKLRYGAVSSLAMVAGVQLDLFTPLKDGPMTLQEMAGALDVRSVKLRPLLYALVPYPGGYWRRLRRNGNGHRGEVPSNQANGN